MPNMKDLSLRVKRLWPMLKFFDGQTDGQKDRRTDGRTDRVITIGHPPSGGALITITHAKYESLISYNKEVMANVKVFQK